MALFGGLGGPGVSVTPRELMHDGGGCTGGFQMSGNVLWVGLTPGMRFSGPGCCRAQHGPRFTFMIIVFCSQMLWDAIGVGFGCWQVPESPWKGFLRSGWPRLGVGVFEV